jgi:hypothetical protein
MDTPGVNNLQVFANTTNTSTGAVVRAERVDVLLHRVEIRQSVLTELVMATGVNNRARIRVTTNRYAEAVWIQIPGREPFEVPRIAPWGTTGDRTFELEFEFATPSWPLHVFASETRSAAWGWGDAAQSILPSFGTFAGSWQQGNWPPGWPNQGGWPPGWPGTNQQGQGQGVISAVAPRNPFIFVSGNMVAPIEFDITTTTDVAEIRIRCMVTGAIGISSSGDTTNNRNWRVQVWMFPTQSDFAWFLVEAFNSAGQQVGSWQTGQIPIVR